MKKKDVELYISFIKNADRIRDEITDAISYIVDETMSLNNSWEFSDINNPISQDGKFVNIRVYTDSHKILYNGEEIDLREQIPVPWVYVAEWEDSYKQARQDYLDKKHQEAEDKKKLIAQAKAKLTAEELAALGIYGR